MNEKIKVRYNEHHEDGIVATLPDDINHPQHYTSHPSGVECIDVVEHMNFNLGNAMKYIWRVDAKGDPIQNLEKAAWYINREITRRQDKSLNERLGD